MNKRILCIPAATLAITLAACGNPAAKSGNAATVDAHAKEVFDKFNGMTGPARTDALVEAAEEEGKLSLYTSNTDIDVIVKAFTDKYDVDVDVYRGNSESVLQRALQESKAGAQSVDIIETNSGELNVLSEESLLYPYESELRDAVRPEGQKKLWTADRFNAFVVAYNTDQMTESELPKTIEGFADPKWRAKISMELGDIDWFAAMWNYYLDKGMSKDEVNKMFSKIAANSKIVKGHTVQAELLSAGEFAAGISMYSHSVQEGTESGNPITWQPKDREAIQPVVVRPNGGGLVGTAQHPAAALLFMDFLLSDGQKSIEDEHRVGSVPSANDPLEGLETVEVDEDEMYNNSKHWDDLYEKVTQGG